MSRAVDLRLDAIELSQDRRVLTAAAVAIWTASPPPSTPTIRSAPWCSPRGPSSGSAAVGAWASFGSVAGSKTSR
jgi:hypothetical protein